MNIAVFIKPVPDPAYYHSIRIDPTTKRLNREGIPTVFNTPDKNALEFALGFKKGPSDKIIVISMAPLFSMPLLKKCLAMGADEAYLLSDRAFGGADTFSTSYTLSKALEKISVKTDLILCGNESTDGATAHVPSQIGEWLHIPHISNVSSLKIDRSLALVSKKIEYGTISYEVKLPALFAVCRDSNTPRLISAFDLVKARSKKLEVYTKDDLCAEEAMFGLSGSPTQPGELHVLEMKRSAKEISGSEKQIAREIYRLIKKSGMGLNRGVSQ